MAGPLGGATACSPTSSAPTPLGREGEVHPAPPDALRLPCPRTGPSFCESGQAAREGCACAAEEAPWRPDERATSFQQSRAKNLSKSLVLWLTEGNKKKSGEAKLQKHQQQQKYEQIRTNLALTLPNALKPGKNARLPGGRSVVVVRRTKTYKVSNYHTKQSFQTNSSLCLSLPLSLSSILQLRERIFPYMIPSTTTIAISFCNKINTTNLLHHQ